MAVGAVPAVLLLLAGGETAVPLQSRHLAVQKMLLAPVTVEGRPFRLMVDTGASFTCLDRRVVDGLGYTPVAEVDVKGFNGRLVSTPLVRVGDLRVGSLPPIVQLAGVVDLSWLNTADDRAAGREVAGILGADFLFRTGGVIDFGRLTLRLTDPVQLALRRFQGRWRSVSVVRNGCPVDAAVTLSVAGDRFSMSYDRHPGARAYTGRLRLDRRSAVGRFVGGDLELLDPPLKPQPVRLGPIEVLGRDDAILSFAGLYELAPGRLTLLVPADLKAGRPPLPKGLTSPAGGGLDLVTFEPAAATDRPPVGH